MQICSNRPGHMTSMAATLIYGIEIKEVHILQELAEPEPKAQPSGLLLRFYKICRQNGNCIDPNQTNS